MRLALPIVVLLVAASVANPPSAAKSPPPIIIHECPVAQPLDLRDLPNWKWGETDAGAQLHEGRA